MLRPVLALYLRVPAANNPPDAMLIGVYSRTHDQLTGGDTCGQRKTPAPGVWKPAESPPSWASLFYASRPQGLGESVCDVLQNPGDPLRHACTVGAVWALHTKEDWDS